MTRSTVTNRAQVSSSTTEHLWWWMMCLIRPLALWKPLRNTCCTMMGQRETAKRRRSEVALWDQTRPGQQLETALQPCGLQKCHCSQLELTGRAPKPAMGPAASGHDRRMQTGRRVGTEPRQE